MIINQIKWQLLKKEFNFLTQFGFMPDEVCIKKFGPEYAGLKTDTRYLNSSEELFIVIDGKIPVQKDLQGADTNLTIAGNQQLGDVLSVQPATHAVWVEQFEACGGGNHCRITIIKLKKEGVDSFLSERIDKSASELKAELKNL